jgi:hypothetical protein
MKTFAALLVLVVAYAFAGEEYGISASKLDMRLEGKIADVRTDRDILSFAFSGKLSFNLDQQHVQWKVLDIPITTHRWTNRFDYMIPKGEMEIGTFSNAVFLVSKRAQADQEAVVILLSPSISFHDVGQIRAIEAQSILVQPKNEIPNTH